MSERRCSLLNGPASGAAVMVPEENVREGWYLFLPLKPWGESPEPPPLARYRWRSDLDAYLYDPQDGE